MPKTLNLKKRILVTLITYTCLLSLAIGLNGFMMNDHLKELIWDKLLNLEIEHFHQQLQHKKISSKKVLWFDNQNGEHIPEEFNRLNPGTYEKVKYKDQAYMIRVIESPQYKQVVAINITKIVRHEYSIILFTLLLTILAVILITIITYHQLNRLINPLLEIAQGLSKVSPDHGQLKIKHDAADKFDESAILVNEINKFVEKSQQFVNKEKEFFEIASHELRTPISAISGAMEIVLKHPETSPQIMHHLKRVSRITYEMEELTAMLLFLSRNKEKLDTYAENMDLAQEIPLIIEDHSHLCRNKELTIINEIKSSIYIKAPPQLLKVTLGNLLRNAIENSDRGTITLSYHKHTFIIDDPGHGMTAQEICALYTQMARNGTSSKSGIGIDLTLKICHHYGWQLSFDSLKGQGTTALLKFKN